jgi:hypothetical protein
MDWLFEAVLWFFGDFLVEVMRRAFRGLWRRMRPRRGQR